MNKLKILALIIFIILDSYSKEKTLSNISNNIYNSISNKSLDNPINWTKAQKDAFYGNTYYENYGESQGSIFKGLKTPLQESVEILKSIPQPPSLRMIDGIDYSVTGKGYLTDYLYPFNKKQINNKPNKEKEKKVELSFENVDLTQFVKYLSDLFNVTFITADNIDPAPDGWKKLEGHKITFKSHKPLTEEQVWDIGLAFLEMAGFSVVPETTLKRTYLIMPNTSTKEFSANKEPLPTFIGVDPNNLPSNDSKIRYVYFISNADINSIAEIINQMTSTSAAKPIIFKDLRAIILTDTSSNIKSIMSIVTELDKVSRPEVLSVVRLNRAEAESVANLINKDLLPRKTPEHAFWGQPAKKASTTSYFSKRLRVVAERRTNSLIILGPEKSVRRLEEFVSKEIDQEIPLPYAPLHIYKVKFLDANNVAKMLMELVKFGGKSTAAETGGVRGQDQYFSKDVAIFAEDSRNSLIIKADYEEYLKIKKILDRLDVQQPQVAIKVLILDVNLDENKQLGTQLRNKVSACNNGIFNNVSFQDSFLGQFQEQTTQATTTNGVTSGYAGAKRLLGNLINLATGQLPGTTLISLGSDACGVWGLLKILETYSRVSVIANPFVIATNKSHATVRLGELRRVPQAIVQGNTTANSFQDDPAYLELQVIPTISYDNTVTLDIFTQIAQFTQQDNPNSGNKIIKGVQTTSIVADQEVLALGGIEQTTINETFYKIPILGDIPLLGVFFKYKSKLVQKRHLLILMSPQIIRAEEKEESQYLTNTKINDAKKVIFEGKDPAEFKDPIYRWFFESYKEKEALEIDNFVSKQSKYSESKVKVPNSKKVLAQKENLKPNNSVLDLIGSKKSNKKGQVA